MIPDETFDMGMVPVRLQMTWTTNFPMHLPVRSINKLSGKNPDICREEPVLLVCILTES